MSGQWFQSITYFIETEYSMPHVTEQHSQTVSFADSKETIGAEFTCICHIALHILKNRMILCTSDMRSYDSHPHTS